MTYIDFYLDKGVNGYLLNSKKLMAKCEQLDFNFDYIVNLLLDSMLTAVLPLDLAIYVATVFLFEG